jgi:hypothetical protein
MQTLAVHAQPLLEAWFCCRKRLRKSANTPCPCEASKSLAPVYPIAARTTGLSFGNRQTEFSVSRVAFPAIFITIKSHHVYSITTRRARRNSSAQIAEIRKEAVRS